jgi:hypothetical protein
MDKLFETYSEYLIDYYQQKNHTKVTIGLFHEPTINVVEFQIIDLNNLIVESIGFYLDNPTKPSLATSWKINSDFSEEFLRLYRDFQRDSKIEKLLK